MNETTIFGFTPETVFALFTVIVVIGAGVIVAIQQRNINALLASVNTALQYKHVRDEGERKYLEASLPTQEVIRLVGVLAKFVGARNLPVIDATVDEIADFIEDVTTKTPDEETPEIQVTTTAQLVKN